MRVRRGGGGSQGCRLVWDKQDAKQGGSTPIAEDTPISGYVAIIRIYPDVGIYADFGAYPSIGVYPDIGVNSDRLANSSLARPSVSLLPTERACALAPRCHIRQLRRRPGAKNNEVQHWSLEHTSAAPVQSQGDSQKTLRNGPRIGLPGSKLVQIERGSVTKPPRGRVGPGSGPKSAIPRTHPPPR